MWVYEKKLEFPVKVGAPNPKLAKAIVTQYGGPDGFSDDFSLTAPATAN